VQDFFEMLRHKLPKRVWLFKDNLEEQIELDSQVWDDLENPLDEG
jgi:hypothetical protein